MAEKDSGQRPSDGAAFMPVSPNVANFLNTIRGRLILGALAIFVLIVAATWIGYATVGRLSSEIDTRLESLRESLQLATELDTRVLEQISAAQWYFVSRDEATRDRFQDLGWEAHDLQRRYTNLDLEPSELAQVEAIQSSHSRLEVEYALAHALLDIGNQDAAVARATATLPLLEELQDQVRGLTSNEAGKLARATSELQRLANERRALLLAALLVTVLIGFLVLWMTIRNVDRPMNQLVVSANRLREGDLRVELQERMLHEFNAVALAFNQMAAKLREIVSETVDTADHISSSATDLSSISEQVAASSGEVATAMVEITTGAEGQSRGLRTTEEALEEMGRRSREIAEASESVETLSKQIHEVAAGSRAQVSGALERLLEVREVVQTSASQVTELEATSTKIDQFVETISGLARQTNLLALNAAIEAARAGEHGRGFSVVADEVRKLAEGSAKAASEVAQSVAEIRSKITQVVSTMEDGRDKVAGVEEVSRDADTALEQIITSVEGVRTASERVAGAVNRNREAAEGVEEALAEVLGTAESHAASAQEVSAAAEEQSAATQELSASSGELLDSAERLKRLVSGFQT
ncbi:MAG: methyl-accepting chemotaxis protein [Longimicrobiaceae bacterium]